MGFVCCWLGFRGLVYCGGSGWGWVLVYCGVVGVWVFGWWVMGLGFGLDGFGWGDMFGFIGL